jgi:hypothetical protein
MVRPNLYPLAAIMVLGTAPASAQQQINPLRFFEGWAENHGTVQVMFKKPYRTRSVGHGRIEQDGSLTLVQRVEDEGQAPQERRWRVREASPGRFIATMTEAVGPVIIEKVGNRYRFRFKMKGNLNVEQWLTPLPGGMAARNSTKIRRLGLTVATVEGLIRKLPTKAAALPISARH